MSLELSDLRAVFGRKIFIDTDHKPLEFIMKKSLLSAPKRLQRILLRLQKFDPDVFYRKGTEMHMADPLSRAYLPLVKQDMVDTQEVWNVADTRSPTEVVTEYVDMAESVPIRKLTLQEIEGATEVDVELQALFPIITHNKAGQREGLKYPSSCRPIFPSEKSCQFRMVLCSRAHCCAI